MFFQAGDKPTNQDLVKEYMSRFYPAMELTHAELKMLDMIQSNIIVTSELSVELANKPDALFEKINIEIKRALARLNCLQLLSAGGTIAYQAFTAQQDSHYQLEEDSFNIVSESIKSLSDDQYEAVRASCFIVKTDEGKKLATKMGITPPGDSEHFLSEMMRQCPYIFPVWTDLSPKAKQLMPAVYLHSSHFRHMFYTEGGEKMFVTMRNKIKNNELTENQFNVWLMRWVINIAGFRGHLTPKGSVYLNQHTAGAMFVLMEELHSLLKNPEHDVLNSYLTTRAKELGLQSNLLAHFACLMRLYTKEQGAELQAWFDGLSEETQVEYGKAYADSCSLDAVATTYEPSLLTNLQHLGCDLGKTLSLFMQIKLSTTEKAKEMHLQNPLCFRQTAYKENLTPLLDYYGEHNEQLPPVKINDFGDPLFDCAYQKAEQFTM